MSRKHLGTSIMDTKISPLTATPKHIHYEEPSPTQARKKPDEGLRRHGEL
jgi:hypothetical protein